MSWSCCKIFFSGACINFWALVYFQGALIFSKRSYFQSAYIFKALMFSERFHIFKALTFSKHSYFQSAHIFKALLFNFSKCKQVLIFYSECKSALIFYSSKYETVSNFCFKTISWSYFFIIFLDYFLICFKC